MVLNLRSVRSAHRIRTSNNNTQFTQSSAQGARS